MDSFSRDRITKAAPKTNFCGTPNSVQSYTASPATVNGIVLWQSSCLTARRRKLRSASLPALPERLLRFDCSSSSSVTGFTWVTSDKLLRSLAPEGGSREGECHRLRVTLPSLVAFLGYKTRFFSIKEMGFETFPFDGTKEMVLEKEEYKNPFWGFCRSVI